MRILFTSGGTGGHIFPIIAIKRSMEVVLNQMGEPANFLFIGGSILDTQWLDYAKIPYKKIISDKWRGYFSPKNILAILKFPIGLIQALFFVAVYFPDVIICKGGEGSSIISFVGWLYGIPIVVHESDMIPGRSNRISAFFAKKIAISFGESAKFFPKFLQKRTILTGNPTRAEVIGADVIKARQFFEISSNRPVVLVIGGSQGAQFINDLVSQIAFRYAEEFEIIHVCGTKNYDELALLIKGAVREDLARFYHLYPFLDEEQMAFAYAAADIVVARAGSGTIYELALNEKPSILIPLESAAQNHQFMNAYVYAKTGAAVVLEKENQTMVFLFERLKQLTRDKTKLALMKKAAQLFCPSSPTLKVVAESLRATKFII